MKRVSTFLQDAWQAFQDLTDDISVCNHPYFGVCHREADEDDKHLFWEARVRIPFSDTFIHVTVPGVDAGPLEEDAEFCERMLANLPAIYRECQPAIDVALKTQGLPALPSKPNDCVLEAVTLPKPGAPEKSWELCLWLGANEHYAIVQFQNGAVHKVFIEP